MVSMWNELQTDANEGMTAELITIILGLRVWQNELGHHSLRELSHYHPELKREEPLTIEEIDALVARLEAEIGR